MNKERTDAMEHRIWQFYEFMPKDFVSENSEFVGWLEEKGFFTAPAAVRHHSNYTGGLFDHSLAVAEALVGYTDRLNLVWDRPWSPYIVGMFHDVCKTEAYHYNHTELTWEHANDQGVIPGHGEKSVIMLLQHIQLSDEEIACIRWHMGAFEGKEMWSGYSGACKKFPNVLYTHTADMYASQVLGI